MRETWTGEVIGTLHVHDKTCKDLARQLGWHDKYLSSVLNGRVNVTTRTKEKVLSALNDLLKEE